MPEKVLVIPREKLFGKGNERYFQGFQVRKNLDFENAIRKHSRFILRKTTSFDQIKPAEEDESMKQVIPYLIFKHRSRYFVYKRLSQSGEERLRKKYSMGIGGHINPVDNSGDVLEEGMKREFEEEVDYPYDYKTKIIGFINDDEDSVGRVHFGVVVLVEGMNDRIKVKEKDKLSGKMMSLLEAKKFRDKMEGWSQIVFDWLRRNHEL